MANQLTGDYDVVVQMGVPRIHAILAAQHQVGVFPHSFTVRLESYELGDRSPVDPRAVVPERPVDPRTTVHRPRPDPRAVRTIPPTPRSRLLGERVFAGPDRFTREEPDFAAFIGSRAFVRADVSRFAAWRVEQLRGIARVQASTPTVALSNGGGTSRVTLHFDVRAHVFLDAGSVQLPEFVHGDVAISVDVGQLAFQRGTQFVLDFDFLAGNLEVTFTPASGTHVDPGDVTTIENAIASLMAGGFVCGSTVVDVPAGVRDMRFRLLPAGSLPTASLVLNLSQHGSNPNTVSTTFVNPNDGFALAISRDYIAGRLQSEIDAAITNALGGRTANVSFLVFEYELSVRGAVVEFHAGHFDLVLGVHARRTGWAWAPDLDVTVRQGCRLYLDQGAVRVKEDGLPVASVTGVPRFIAERFEKEVVGWVKGQGSQFLAPVSAQVQQALATLDLAGVLTDLQVPSPKTEYTAVEVTTDGVILRGALTLAAREKPTAANETTALTLGGQPHVRLDAFASWIPGGVVQRYTWDGAVRTTDDHRFAHDEPVTWSGGPGRWCVQVAGLQTTDTGGQLKVSRWSCRPVSMVAGLLPGMLDAPLRDRHPILVPHMGPDPVPDTLIDPWAAGLTSGSPGANLLVHFADDAWPEGLRVIREAVARSELAPTSVFVVVVLPTGGLERSRAGGREAGADGGVLVSLTEDFEGGWGRTFDVGERPATFLVGSLGHVRWNRVGRLDPQGLASILREFAPAEGGARFHPMPLAVEQGDRAPDFRFELEPGVDVPLRRLRRQPVTLVFWTSWAPGSLEELRRVERRAAEAGDPPALVLAINDGEDAEHAREVFGRGGFGSHLVPDPERAIATAYGVHCWPTTISIEGHGRVWNVEMGGGAHHDDEDAPGAAAAV